MCLQDDTNIDAAITCLVKTILSAEEERASVTPETEGSVVVLPRFDYRAKHRGLGGCSACTSFKPKDRDGNWRDDDTETSCYIFKTWKINMVAFYWLICLIVSKHFGSFYYSQAEQTQDVLLWNMSKNISCWIKILLTVKCLSSVVSHGLICLFVSFKLHQSHHEAIFSVLHLFGFFASRFKMQHMEVHMEIKMLWLKNMLLVSWCLSSHHFL